jgi:hypothetical protein
MAQWIGWVWHDGGDNGRDGTAESAAKLFQEARGVRKPCLSISGRSSSTYLLEERGGRIGWNRPDPAK